MTYSCGSLIGKYPFCMALASRLKRMSAEITVKRVYSEAKPEVDGCRILVDRLWPRGISKDRAHLNQWLKDVAPSPELRTWWNHNAALYGEFAERYRAQLDANPAVAQLIEQARQINGRITLVYGAKDPVINHAHILRNYIMDALFQPTDTVTSASGFEIATIPAHNSTHTTQSFHNSTQTAQTTSSVKWNLDGLTVREATLDDVQLLQWAGAVTFEDTFIGTSSQRDMDDYIAETFSAEQISHELSHPLMHYVIVEDNASGEVAAYLKFNEIGGQTEEGEEIPTNSLEIQRLYVMQRFKRRGLGSYLMHCALNAAHKLNLETCWLGVWEYNFAAQKFYEKWGFKRFSQHSFIVGEDNQTDFLFSCSLDD